MEKQLLVISLFIINILFSQEIDYKNISKDTKGFHSSYLAKDSIIYKIGDNIKIGNPSEFTFKNIYIFQIMGYLKMSLQDAAVLGENVKIISISVLGNKKKGYRAYVVASSLRGVNFSIDFEKALETGEIISNIMTSDEALALLKKEKDKLDLEIITQQEYNIIKEKLVKYIK